MSGGQDEAAEYITTISLPEETMTRKPLAKKTIYTTGDVADSCHVSNRTASKWLDEGIIKGYRIPGSNHRRVLHEDLIGFMKTHNIPIPGELA